MDLRRIVDALLDHNALHLRMLAMLALATVFALLNVLLWTGFLTHSIASGSLSTPAPKPQIITPTGTGGSSIPKKIWTFWQDDNLSAFVKDIVYGWKRHNPTYEVTVITEDTISDYIRYPLPSGFADLSTDHKGDWIRLAVLMENGGVWIDATTIVSGSVDYLDEMAKKAGSEAFAFHLDRFTKYPERPVMEPFVIGTAPKAKWITAWFNEFNAVVGSFKMSDEYLDYLFNRYGGDLYDRIIQKNDMPEDLKIHVAGQKVLAMDNVPLPYSESAEKMPYRLLEEADGSDDEVARRIMEVEYPDEEVPLFIKLRQDSRVTAEELLEDGVKVSDRSIYNRFVRNSASILRMLKLSITGIDGAGSRKVIKKKKKISKSSEKKAASADNGEVVASIPKKIWTFWHDNNPPQTIQECIYGWKRFNPDYEITVITEDNLSDYIRMPVPYSFQDAYVSFKADWVRLAVLREQGGIWLDASIIVTDSLDWIQEKAANHKKDSFAFHLDFYTQDYQYPVLEPWLIATAPNGRFISSWFSEFNIAMSNFEMSDDYLDHLNFLYGEKGYSQILQGNTMPEYLKIHMAAQKVAVMDKVPGPYSESAEKMPYMFMEEMDWEDEEVALMLLEVDFKNKYVPPLTKMRSRGRLALEHYLNTEKVKVLDQSIYAMFLRNSVEAVRKMGLGINGLDEMKKGETKKEEAKKEETKKEETKKEETKKEETKKEETKKEELSKSVNLPTAVSDVYATTLVAPPTQITGNVHPSPGVKKEKLPETMQDYPQPGKKHEHHATRKIHPPLKTHSHSKKLTEEKAR
ncbi:hypothetical protein HDU67_006775 [Dinochytrium kinnereticum]|nr:hypothetical protein HDU67_006775 [Dinochytrium kinnereticum]